jgi:hypothetical protein
MVVGVAAGLADTVDSDPAGALLDQEGKLVARMFLFHGTKNRKVFECHFLSVPSGRELAENDHRSIS